MKRGKLLLIVTTVIFFPRSVVIHWTKWKHVLTLKKEPIQAQQHAISR